MWLDCGRPRSGAVSVCMRRSRLAYHYAIRKVRKDEEFIKSERIATSMLSNNTRDFWAEIKRIRSNSAGISSTIDGASDSQSISKIFVNKYRELYTCVCHSVDDLRSIRDEINDKICQEASSDDLFFNGLGIRAAARRLKPHKNDVCAGLASDHFINAGDDCFAHLTMLFNAIVVHGDLPDTFLYSTIVPIPKGRNVNLSDSSNYRGIALSSLYGKLFDNAVLMYFSDKLTTSDLQFGFKARSSTSQCTFVLKESLAYYINNNSTVYCAFLDATKAFDRVNYCKLFRLIIRRKLPLLLVRVMLNFYISNFVRVSWCGYFSEYFLATNGVKQGGVLSPVLFCVYLDELLLALSAAKVGCYVGSVFVGALAYADDLVLIAPSATALRKMLAICDAYASDYFMNFNAGKSKCMVILSRGRRTLRPLISKCSFKIG